MTTTSHASPSAPSTSPPEVHCRAVASAAELELHHDIRARVFVDEQRIFTGTDRDDHDSDPATVHVLGFCHGEVAGTVRLLPLGDEGVWQGDRLAVLPAYRARHVAEPLVRFAVRTAGERGGRLMRAHIQVGNVRFFRRLGWTCLGGPADYLGRPHQDMVIELDSGFRPPSARTSGPPS
jgi:putative N-acetyltransferase (TIGR04045 family)